MLIGEASSRSGCHIETIRYYERVGLLPAPTRGANGYRHYSDDHVRRLHFITRGRELGFSIEEIRSLLQLADDPKLSCSDVDQMARDHLREVRSKLRELRAIADELQRTIDGCAGGDREHCAILHALESCGEAGEECRHGGNSVNL